jgi:transcriptional regulator of arginine metabolism
MHAGTRHVNGFCERFVIIRVAMKRARQKAILDLVRGGNIASQEELLEGLQSRNIEVSQSTLSRDIQELRLAKAGGYYAVVGAEPKRPSDESLGWIVREFVTSIDVAGNLVIIKTPSGNASTVSQALDDANWAEQVGNIAGENTIFMAVRSEKDARRVEKRLRDLLS